MFNHFVCVHVSSKITFNNMIYIVIMGKNFKKKLSRALQQVEVLLKQEIEKKLFLLSSIQFTSDSWLRVDF